MRGKDQKTDKTVELSVQVQGFETDFRKQFDSNGWDSFKLASAAYINDLCLEALRETHNQAKEMRVLTTAKDVERASARLDHRRHFRRAESKYWFQIGGLIGSILSGIVANWAFADFGKETRSVFPWIVLLAVTVVTVALFGKGLQKETEP